MNFMNFMIGLEKVHILLLFRKIEFNLVKPGQKVRSARCIALTFAIFAARKLIQLPLKVLLLLTFTAL